MNFETGTPKAFECFSPELQGTSYPWEQRAKSAQPSRALHLWTGIVRFNPCGVGALREEPRVSVPPSRQPWARCCNALGVGAHKCITRSRAAHALWRKSEWSMRQANASQGRPAREGASRSSSRGRRRKRAAQAKESWCSRNSCDARIARSEWLGRGNEFFVHLPFLLRPPAPVSVAPLSDRGNRDASRRILILDDNTASAHRMAVLGNPPRSCDAHRFQRVGRARGRC
ncbi:MAG: hypothetical protein JWQ44_2654 [Chthoniobacter sp.]|nr:hypothetical protein [Chthoniobacter sp.]